MKGSHGLKAFAAALLLLLLPVAAPAADFTIVSTDDLKAMIDAKRAFVLIDARTKDEYQEAHIVKALNIPEKEFEKLLSILPQDRGTRLVIYCNGVKCGKSRKVAVKTAEAGYTDILIYAEGFPVWEERAYPIVPGPEYGKKIETAKLKPAALREMIDSKADDFVLIDVRDEQEFKEGRIPGAVNIPVETFALRSEVLPKEKKIVVYCNTGGRSYTAYRKLIKLAYPNIYQTTFADWKDAGMQVEK